MLKNLKDIFAKLDKKFSLDNLSDKNLKRIAKVSQVSATLAAGHAGIWIAIGIVGAIAVGLNAAGVCIPMFLGVGTIALGGLFALKAAVVNRGCTALYKACAHALEKRGIKLENKKPAPTPTAMPEAAPAKVAATPPLTPAFTPAAQPPQPEAKNDNTPAPPVTPAKQEPPKP